MTPSSDSQPKSRWSFVLYTILIYLSIVCQGLTHVTSATLLDVAEQTHSTTSLVSIGFAVYAASQGLGSLFAKWLLKHMEKQMIIIACLMCISLALLLVPMVDNVSYYWITQFVTGISVAGLTMSSNFWLKDMWSGDSVTPLTHGLFLCSLVGTAMSALIVSPFLSQVIAFVERKRLIYIPVQALCASHIATPYSLMSAFCLFMAIVHGLFCVSLPYVEKPDAKEELVTVADETSEHEVQSSKSGRIMASRSLVIACLMVACMEGVTFNTMSFIPTFGVFCDLHLSKQEGAVMSGITFASSAVALTLIAWIATRVSTRIMLFVASVVVLIANIILFFASVYSLNLMFFAVVLLGIGNSIFSPNTFSVISNQENGMFASGALIKAMVQIVSSSLTGFWIQDHPSILIIMNSTCLSIAIFSICFLRSSD